MIQQMFACYDNKAGAYAAPFFCATVGLGVRAFTEAANMRDHPVAKHPTDFSLFLLGTFDDVTGTLETLTEPKNLGLASNFVKESSNVRQIA